MVEGGQRPGRHEFGGDFNRTVRQPVADGHVVPGQRVRASIGSGRTELVEGHVVVAVQPADLERHADLELVGSHADDVGDHPDTLLELHQADHERIVEGGDLRMFRGGPAVEEAPTGGDNPVVRHVMGRRIGDDRGVHEASAAGEALDAQLVLPQPLPVPCLVLVPAGTGAFGPGRVVHRFVATLPAGARPELEDPEGERSDRVTVLVRVGDLGRHEVAGAECRLLLGGDAGERRPGGHDVAGSEVAFVGLVRVGGDDACEPGVVE